MQLCEFKKKKKKNTSVGNDQNNSIPQGQGSKTK